MAGKKYWALSSVLGCCLNINPAYGQVVPDKTTNTTVINSCQNICDITGGIVSGDNLFHSFAEFNLGIGESAYFNDPYVSNIFSRVTGSNPSEIFGTLGISGGDANLWLLNPNGIVFGQGAALDINGSFFATTADQIHFGDRTFSALPDTAENLALLTINPTALFFNQLGQNHPINLDSGARLDVAEQNNITLLGGQFNSQQPGINVSNSSLINAPQGNIYLGSLNDMGKIDIDNDLRFNIPQNLNKGDIAITEKSEINVSGLGAGQIHLDGHDISMSGASNIIANTLGDIDGQGIDINAQNLIIADNSLIISSTVGKGDSSQINISAQESVDIVGKDIEAFQTFLLNTLAGGDRSNNVSSSIYTFSQGDGTAGDIKIQGKNVALQNGAWILASTLDSGNAGDIEINADNNLSINGSGLISGAALNSQGNAGNLTVNSDNLQIQNSGIITSGTLGAGQGGDINLDVTSSIKLFQSLPNTILPTGIFTNTVGNVGKAGNLNIDTGNLILEDGSQLSSASGAITSQGIIPFGGQGGNITIDSELIEIKGSSPDDLFASGIINDSYSSNSAGKVFIQTNKLKLSEKAFISASSINTGKGGSLSIFAEESIHLSSLGFENLQQVFLGTLAGEINPNDLNGGLLTNTRNGQGGNITIDSPRLTLEEGALISSSTFGLGNGGNVDIASENINIIDSAIVGSTINQGSAGNLNIQTNQLSLLNAVLVTSSTGLSDAGDVEVNATESIELVGDNASLISTGIFTANTNGYPGNLEINTENLVIRGGSKIDASSGESNIQEIQDILGDMDNAGQEINEDIQKNLIINADSIKIFGTSMNGFFSSTVTTSTGSSFPASDIQINSSQLEISDQGKIAVSSFGEGEAGSLTINSDSILLEDQGSLNASSLSGQGGNIELQVNDLLSLNRDAAIQTDAMGLGNGGNIFIDTTFVLAANMSNISAKAISGQGGNINITATDLFVSPSSQISASSDLGIDGEVNIKTFNPNERNTLIKLPEKTIQANNLIVHSCGASKGKGAFIYTGKGGLSPNLLIEVIHRDAIADLDNYNNLLNKAPLKAENHQLNHQFSQIVEAGNWKVNPQGKIELVVAENSNLNNVKSPSLQCS